MIHVLIVEDNEPSRYLLQALLEGSGYRVTQATNGIEALALARREPPDIIVSDALMPKMDGFALCRAWMQDDQLKLIPFVFYSATYTSPEDETLALALGAVRYLVKPVEPQLFLAALQTVLMEWAARPAPGSDAPLAERDFRSLHDGALARKLDQKMAELAEANLKLAQSERNYRQLFEDNPHPMWVRDLETLAILVVNNAAIAAYGYSRAEFMAMSAVDLHPAEDKAHFLRAIDAVKHGIPMSGIWQHHKKDGTPILAEITSHLIEFNGRQANMVQAQDVTERERVEAALRQSAMVFGSTRDGIIITDLNGSILSVNQAFTSITGYPEAEVLGQNPRLLQSGRHERGFYQTLWASVHATGHWQGEVWNRRKNGEVFPEWLSISTLPDDAGQPHRYVAVFSDISQIKQGEAKLEHLAHYDALTELPNRLLLFSRLEHCIDLARRDEKMLALLMLDLDRFKTVNDSFGHLLGDELLQQVAKRLSSRLRGVDTICRLGGDEFVVLIEKIEQEEDAARVANDIITALNEPWHLSNGTEVRIGVSVGISLYPAHGHSAQELLQQADASLYQAKAEGRGRFKYFSEELTRTVRERIVLEARLRHAIDAGELRVFYQPQVDIASGRIVGAEALVRWQDPVGGLIAPIYFIPVAEETGLITPIGNWVLQETCRQGQRWLAAGLPPLRLAVNLSAHQFMHSKLQDVVAAALAQSGFPAAWLELELTESALMEREDEAIEILAQLRGLGVQLAIDDFGTGYSSLSYLKRFPLDILKIDKSFVDNLSQDADDQAIASTIIAMAHTLRLKALAEGVETQEQLDFLRSRGCDMYQGYLTSRPVPADQFAQLLRAATR